MVMGLEKIYCFGIASLGWFLLSFGVQRESPFFGIALICTAILGWLLCRAAEHIKASGSPTERT